MTSTNEPIQPTIISCLGRADSQSARPFSSQARTWKPSWPSTGHRLAIKVIPLQPGTKKGYRRWPEHATSDPHEIARLARKFPKSRGIGLLCNDLLAVDVDGLEGDAVIGDFERRGCHFPKTMTFRSPEKADHYKFVYRAPEGVEFKQADGWAAMEFTRRRSTSRRGTIWSSPAAPLHKCGLPTITENEMAFSDLPEAPAWLVDLLVSQGHVKTKAELEAAAKRQNGKRHSEWHDDGFSIKLYVEMAIAQFPTSVGHRHDPTIRLIAKLCCSALNDEQIMEVGKLWLRHYEGRYGLTFEQAMARFQTILTSTRSNPRFIPYKPDILSVSLPPRFQSFLNEIEEMEGRPSRILVEVVMREWMLEIEKRNKTPPHHPTLSGVEVENVFLSTPITLTWKQVKDGYRLLSQAGIDDHKFLDLKAKFFSLPDWGENGTRAKKLELFIRTSKGAPGRPSIYEPSEWLIRRLSGAEVPKRAEMVKVEMVNTDASERDNIRKALMASKSGYYKTAYYKNFVDTVKQRDHHTCQACGTRFNQSDMRVVCIRGMVGRIRDAINYACACKKCATLHGAINRGDDLAVSKHKPERIKQVIEAWHPDLMEVENG